MEKLDNVNDGSGLVVQVGFTDELGNAVVPNSATWTLTCNESVINSRENVSITPASTVYVALTSADTAYVDGPRRTLVIDGTYTSSLTGGPVTIRQGCYFNITDLPR